MQGRRWWLLAVLGVVVLLGHSTALYFLRPHFNLSTAVMAVVIALVVVVHLARRWSQRGH
jgi:hypothetical protein